MAGLVPGMGVASHLEHPLDTGMDAFRCLPQYGNDLRWQYNLQLKLIAESDLLSSIISQLVGRRVQIGKLDPTLHLDIMESNYALS